MLANIAGILTALATLTLTALLFYHEYLFRHKEMGWLSFILSIFGLVGAPIFAAVYLVFMLWGI
jgi:hypothetical protein